MFSNQGSDPLLFRLTLCKFHVTGPNGSGGWKAENEKVKIHK